MPSAGGAPVKISRENFRSAKNNKVFGLGEANGWVLQHQNTTYVKKLRSFVYV